MTRPVMMASPIPITAWTSASQLRTLKKSARRSRRRELDREGAGRQQDGEPGRDHGADEHASPAADQAANRRIDRIAADRSDQSHVHEVGPQRREAAVTEQEALDDQHRRDDHRPCPGPEHHRRQHAAQQVPGDPGPTGKLTICAAKMKAAIIPMSGVVRSLSRRSTALRQYPSPPAPTAPVTAATPGTRSAIRNMHLSCPESPRTHADRSSATPPP